MVKCCAGDADARIGPREGGSGSGCDFNNAMESEREKKQRWSMKHKDTFNHNNFMEFGIINIISSLSCRAAAIKHKLQSHREETKARGDGGK